MVFLYRLYRYIYYILDTTKRCLFQTTYSLILFNTTCRLRDQKTPFVKIRRFDMVVRKFKPIFRFINSIICLVFVQNKQIGCCLQLHIHTNIQTSNTISGRYNSLVNSLLYPLAEYIYLPWCEKGFTWTMANTDLKIRRILSDMSIMALRLGKL